jgi:acetyl-CoA decarbonylase/synthase complex subunit delta
MINNIGNEVWKCKEVKQPIDEAPAQGDPERRAIMMEATAAVCYLLAGSDIAILRHPESVRLTRSFIDLMINGGMATDVTEIAKNLDLEEADLAAISPKPNLDFGEKEAPKKKDAPKPKKEAKKAAPKPKKEAKKAEPKPKKKEEPKVEAKDEAKVKAEEEAKAKADTEAVAKAEEDVKAKAEADAKAKEEAEAKAKADAEAAAKAEEDARKKAEADARAKRDAEEDEQRQKRAAEREKIAAERGKVPEKPVTMTPAAEQKTEQEKILDQLNRIHRRIPLY